MACDAVREYLLEVGWDAEQRFRTAEMLDHARSCPACQAALEDFDRIRAAVATGELEEPVGGWDALQYRLGSPGPSARQPTARPSPKRRWTLAGAAVAACLAIVAVVMFEVGREWGEPPPDRSDQLVEQHGHVLAPLAESDSPPISPTEVSNEVEAFRRVSHAYDGQAGWMMVSQNDADFGMATTPAAPTDKVFLLRLDLWHQQKLASSSDLLVLAGQTADLTVPLAGGESLHYRIGTAPPAAGTAQLHLWLDLKTARAASPLAALSTTLQLHSDQKITAGKLTTSLGEYELKIEFKPAELTSNSH